MARRLILVLLFCLGLANTHANEIEKNRGVMTGFHNGSLPGDYGLQFHYQVSFRLWPLLNEPVYDIKLTWSFDERAQLLPPPQLFLEFEDMPEGGLIRNLDPETRDTLRPYDLKVRIEGHAADNPQARYFVIWDVGVPGGSGEPSYNTPASPAWDELFRRHAVGAGGWISADEAKSVMKAGFIADRIMIESVKWRTDEYLRQMQKRYPRGKMTALKRSAGRHIDLLNQLQGLPRDKLDARLETLLNAAEAKRKKGEPDFLVELERFVARFDAGLPAPMRNGGLEPQYEAALADIRREYETEMTAAATTQFQFPDRYPQWLEEKQAELAARKEIKADTSNEPNELKGDFEFYQSDSGPNIAFRYRVPSGDEYSVWLCEYRCYLTVGDDYWGLSSPNSDGSVAGEYEYDGEGLTGFVSLVSSGSVMSNGCTFPIKFRKLGINEYNQQLYELTIVDHLYRKPDGSDEACFNRFGQSGRIIGVRR